MTDKEQGMSELLAQALEAIKTQSTTLMNEIRTAHSGAQKGSAERKAYRVLYDDRLTPVRARYKGAKTALDNEEFGDLSDEVWSMIEELDKLKTDFAETKEAYGRPSETVEEVAQVRSTDAPAPPAQEQRPPARRRPRRERGADPLVQDIQNS